MAFWNKQRLAVTGVVGVAGLAVVLGTATQGGGEQRRAFLPTQAARAVVLEKTVGESAEREQAREEEGESERAGEPIGEGEILNGASAEEVDKRAYPRGYVDARRAAASRRAYDRLPATLKPSDFRKGTPKASRVAALASSWTELGPVNGVVPAEVTYTGRATTTSGRVTAMAIDPSCTPGDCRLWVAAAGGGIWRTPDALAAVPSWEPLDNGLTSNSFGSLVIDPNDPTSNTLYAGSGEPNGSGDSEAGVGLFRTTDGGERWTLVPGSPAVAKDRSIGAIAIDQSDPNTIWIGTAIARHGLASVSGGRRTPPNAPPLGIYRSTDNGKFFSLEFSKPGDGVDPSTGSDFFTGGIRRLTFDPNDPGQLYASIQGYGIYRVNNANDGVDLGTWHQVFRANYGRDNFPGNAVDPIGALTDFDLAAVGASTRIYVGDTSDATMNPAMPTWAALFVADDVNNLSADDLLAAQKAEAAPWQARSSADITDPDGFSSFNWCQNGQCLYDSFVKVDPNNPDVVYLGGAMNYDEIFYPDQNRSNGRAVIRSTDAGVTFTDMTNDAQTPAPEGMHPDQHALVFNPSNTEQVLIGSDGGVVRTSGSFVDASADCDDRPEINADDVAFCKVVLAQIPTRIDSLNVGLNTLQFQALSLNPEQPYTDVIGGTQDNGTWAWDGAGNWFESVGGDGGPAGISPDAVAPGQDSRMHTYYYGAGDVNFHGNDPTSWLFNTGPIFNSTENIAFYAPLLADPVVPGTYFMGAESVWRTQDSGGSEAELIANHCAETDPENVMGPECGNFEVIGGGPVATDPGDYVVAISRAESDNSTLWIGLRNGGLFISHNADAAPADVTFTEIDTATTPGRFISGIAVDPQDAHHAWISYSGYSAYTPDTPGHVFEAWYDPTSETATFTDRSYDLGDQPITGVAFDAPTGDVYVSTDFGSARLAAGARSWAKTAEDLPPVATYGLTIDPTSRVLYAATHGRGAYGLALNPAAMIDGPATGVVGTPLAFTAGDSSGFKSTAYAWTFPDGSTSTAQAAGYTPTKTGEQIVKLTVTDELGHSTTATSTVDVSSAPAGALTPAFGAVTRTADGFTVPITNFNSGYQWSTNPSAGKAAVGSSGLLTVTGLSPKASSTVIVTTDLPGAPQGSASVTGKAQGQCSLTMKAKSGNKKLPTKGSTKVVTSAKTSGKCSVGKPVVTSSPLGKGKSKVQVDRKQKGALVITTYKGSRVKVTAKYTAESSKQGVNPKTWTRTWRSK